MKFLSKAFIVANVFSSCIAFALPTQAVNLLLNSGFETGDLTGWSIDGETIEFGVNSDGVDISENTPLFFNPSLQNVRSGDFAAYALVRNSPRETAIFSQTVNAEPDTTYLIGYWVGADSSTDGFGLFTDRGLNPRIFANDINIQATGPIEFDTGSEPSDFVFVSGQYTTGETETSVLVNYTVIGSGTARGAFSVDDFTFEEVPEPLPIMTLPIIICVGLLLRRKYECVSHDELSSADSGKHPS